MGVKELREAVTAALDGKAVCTRATLSYDHVDGVEWQILEFSGNFADGTAFTIKSAPVPGRGDLIQASRDTAQQLLQKRVTT